MAWVSTERNHDEQPITVGVIDDDPMICQMMRLILEDYSSGRISAVSTCTSNRLSPDVTKHAPCSTLCRSANVKRSSSRPKDSQMRKSVKKMFISERTVKVHLSSAADKLYMGRVQMARLVERANLPPRL